MSFHQIKAVFFDAAGTLFTVNGSVGDIYARLAHAYGKEVAVEDLEAGFRRCFATAPAMAFPGAAPEQIHTLEKRWWYDLVQGVFASLGPFPQFDAYFAALFAYFARPDAWRLYPETVETLIALRTRGLRLGVISNFDSRLFGLLEGFGIAGFFDPIVISTQAGYAKPAVEIFTQALAQHHLCSEEAVHVGDSLQMDVAGASAAGLLPVFVDRHGAEGETGSYLRVKNLAELLTIIGA